MDSSASVGMTVCMYSVKTRDIGGLKILFFLLIPFGFAQGRLCLKIIEICGLYDPCARASGFCSTNAIFVTIRANPWPIQKSHFCEKSSPEMTFQDLHVSFFEPPSKTSYFADIFFEKDRLFELAALA